MDECVEATITCHEKTQDLDKDDPVREQIGACLKAENKKDIEEKLTDENKEDCEKKSQGQLQCHLGPGGKCQERTANGKTPDNSISSAAAGRYDDAVSDGRC